MEFHDNSIRPDAIRMSPEKLRSAMCPQQWYLIVCNGWDASHHCKNVPVTGNDSDCSEIAQCTNYASYELVTSVFRVTGNPEVTGCVCEVAFFGSYGFGLPRTRFREVWSGV
jgi:hypothetical protein